MHSYVLVRDDPAGTILVEVLSDGASDLWLVRPEGRRLTFGRSPWADRHWIVSSRPDSIGAGGSR